jgi:hypothetical protein
MDIQLERATKDRVHVLAIDDTWWDTAPVTDVGTGKQQQMWQHDNSSEKV